MSDLISRRAAISLPVKPKEDRYFQTQNLDDAYEYGWRDLQGCIEKMPSAQPRLNKKRISDLLWNEYRTMSPHLSAEGVVARRYYCKELWKELFGEEETPVWMTW